MKEPICPSPRRPGRSFPTDRYIRSGRPLSRHETVRAAELRGIRLGDFDLYDRAITVLGKGSKRRRIRISIELVNTVDEHLLTGYPVLERLPVLADHLWFPVHKVGDRIINLVPDKAAATKAGTFSVKLDPGKSATVVVPFGVPAGNTAVDSIELHDAAVSAGISVVPRP